MKIFAGALLGAVATIVLLGIALRLGGGYSGDLRPRTADDRAIQLDQARHDAARLREQRLHPDRQRDELQEQRRERVALLTATLRTRPLGLLTAAEKHLFQEAERDRTRMSADRATIKLTEPVQIDEWTVLRRGTAVEFERAYRDNLITIRHDGARYQVSPCQTELRAISGEVCEE